MHSDPEIRLLVVEKGTCFEAIRRAQDLAAELARLLAVEGISEHPELQSDAVASQVLVATLIRQMKGRILSIDRIIGELQYRF